jgi:N-acetylglucosamine-6-sulfatase
MRRRDLFLGAAAVAGVNAQGKRRNIVFILSDDHRYDMMSFMGHPWLKTPNLDRLRADGALFRNSFVTTSLCSPSRASILTGQYMHAHGVKDNFTPLPPSLATFPQLLQKQGYRTGFLGKWHMGGDSDEPRPGFDHWVAFRGQGEYIDPTFNFNGTRRKTPGYVTDLLTDEARSFIKANATRPFMLYLSHKAVHAPFQPAERHKNIYANDPIPWPKSMLYKEEYYEQLPEWVKRRRYSRHGVDGAMGQTATVDEYYRGYCRCLQAIDESVGKVMDELKSQGLLDDTLIVYMGDNGYLWGEHGLVDKRSMHEPSLRVPILAHCPSMFPAGTTVEKMALNLDIAPTFLDVAGIAPPQSMQGRSLLPLLQGKTAGWRTDFLYEYEWEQDYPYTPTITGLRTETHSLMQSWGVWDMNELYDLRNDPDQMSNLLSSIKIRHRGRIGTLIQDKELAKMVEGMQDRMAEILKTTGGDPRYSGKGSEGDKFAM